MRDVVAGRAILQQPPGDGRLAAIAERQWGVFTSEQARAAGLERSAWRHRVRTGRWEQLTPTVFRIAGVPTSWHADLTAATLAWGSDIAISHRSAAALWQLTEPTSIVELTVPRHRRRAAPGIIHRGSLARSDVVRRLGLPVTTVSRTLLDLASVSDPGATEEALDAALRQRLTTLARLRGSISNPSMTRGRHGVACLRALLDERDEGTPESVFETRLHRLIRRAHLPPPKVQYVVKDRGRAVARVDLAYPEHRLAIEADGYRWHSARSAWARDLRRRDALTLLGWRVLHITWDQIEAEPAEVVARIRRALGS